MELENKNPDQFDNIFPVEVESDDSQKAILNYTSLNKDLLPENWESNDTIFCITLYNEPLEDLKKTLFSLQNSIEHYRCQPQHIENKAIIAIITDGIEKLDQEILLWLTHNQFLAIHDPNNPATPPMGWHLNTSDNEVLNTDSFSKNTSQINSVVYLKPNNKGKLHSHAFLFKELCENVNAQFVFQIDTGTIVHEHAVKNCIDHFNKHPNTAAIAARIAVEPADINSSLSHTWQYIDMTVQSITWPAEEVSGYLSVIPGQFCAFRWQALSDTNYRDESKTSITEYLHGLDPRNLFEKILYLTEDRVIGTNLVCKQKESWQIKYMPKVIATTDSCKTLRSLFRQRRRWDNGALAGRLLFLSQLPGFLCRSDRSITQKTNTLIAGIWQLILVFFSLAGPAIAISMLGLLTLDLTRLFSTGNWALALLMITSLSIAIVATATYRKGRSLIDPKFRDMSSAVFIALWFCIAEHQIIMMFLVVPVVLTLMASTLLHPDQLYLYLRRTPQYLVIGTFLRTAMFCYSIFRLNDVSWGTKGLTQTGSLFSPFIILLQACWVVATIALILWGFSQPGIFIGNMNPLLEIWSFFNIVTLLCALGFYLHLHYFTHEKSF